MTSLLERFIPEAREYLEGAAAGLLKLERNPGDGLLVNEVFRAVHTLKGASGLFDLPGLTRLVHAGEDLLDAVRSNRLTLDSEIVDRLLDSIDRVSAWIDELQQHGRLPDDADRVSVALSKRLRVLLPDSGEAVAAGASIVTPAQVDWLADLPEDERLAAFAETVAGGPPLVAISYIPDEGSFYRGEDPFNLFPQLAGLKTLRVFFRNPPPKLADLDPFLSTLAFQALVGQPCGEVDHLFRYVLDQTVIAPIRAEALILLSGEIGAAPLHQHFVNDAQRLLQAGDFAGLRAAIKQPVVTADNDPWGASALRWLDAILAAPEPNESWAREMVTAIAQGRPPIFKQEAPALSAAIAPTAAEARETPMAARILTEQILILSTSGDPATLSRRIIAIEATVGSLLASLGWSTHGGELQAASEAASDGEPECLHDLLIGLRKRVEATVAGSPPVPASGALLLATDAPKETLQSNTGDAVQVAHVLKVDQAKIDALLNLIAELVVCKNSLPFLAKRAEEFYGSREMGREIKDQYAIIDRLAQEMQRAIMAVRMLPVSEVFERFPRLVRDLSRKLNKQIELRITGEDTAADKTIIEALGDPLIHLVRNSIDHGIESPEARLAAGKPEVATIQLRAFQEGDQVIIEVSDDGKGIDPMAIRLKAFEKGMISEAKVDLLSDQEAINLIFLPGFSTANEISDLSGRGVGTDVVRSAIEKIHGKVTLSSRKGEGTLVRMSLPLSMAVARVMMVEVGDALFGVPMDGVAETVRVARTAIRHIKRSQAFVLRETVVPLMHLHDLLGLRRRSEEVNEEAVLVARVGGTTVGLIVDRLREGIDVILKPLEGLLAGIRGYSGSALLGDGRVLLVLNLKELL